MIKDTFAEQDYILAHEEFSKWQAQQCETIDEYTLRRRKAQLRELVKKVIKNELNDHEQKLVELHWYKNVSKEEISKLYGVEKSTVYRQFEKINNIIFQKLQYAMEYRFGIDEDKELNLIVATKHIKDNCSCSIDISDRLKNLRNAQFWDLQTLSHISDISVKRLTRLEKKLEMFTLNDIKKFSKIFDVSTDYLIFGDS